MRDRAQRIQEMRRILKQRGRRAKLTLLGMSPKIKRQPHRLAKMKAKFTHQRSSMKAEKQEANRALRARTRDAIRRGREPGAEPKNSVRWDYW